MTIKTRSLPNILLRQHLFDDVVRHTPSSTASTTSRLTQNHHITYICIFRLFIHNRQYFALRWTTLLLRTILLQQRAHTYFVYLTYLWPYVICHSTTSIPRVFPSNIHAAPGGLFALYIDTLRSIFSSNFFILIPNISFRSMLREHRTHSRRFRGSDSVLCEEGKP